MNIFAISDNPDECARALDDKRLNKMVLETAQLLCSAIILNGGTAPYKLTHKGHPCTKWVAASMANYLWTLSLFESLAHEFDHRFPKPHTPWHLNHKSYDKCYYTARIGSNRIPDGPMTPRPQCTPGIPETSDVYQAYRDYLCTKWDADVYPRWTDREPPAWWTRSE